MAPNGDRKSQVQLAEVASTARRQEVAGSASGSCTHGTVRGKTI